MYFFTIYFLGNTLEHALYSYQTHAVLVLASLYHVCLYKYHRTLKSEKTLKFSLIPHIFLNCTILEFLEISVQMLGWQNNVMKSTAVISYMKLYPAEQIYSALKLEINVCYAQWMVQKYLKG